MTKFVFSQQILVDSEDLSKKNTYQATTQKYKHITIFDRVDDAITKNTKKNQKEVCDRIIVKHQVINSLIDMKWNDEKTLPWG